MESTETIERGLYNPSPQEMAEQERVSLLPRPKTEMVQVEPPDPMTLLSRAIDSGRSAQELQGLLDLVKRVKEEAAEQHFNQAMNLCQREMPVVVRDAKNSHTNSRYARLENVQQTIRPTYSKHGFSLSYDEEKCETPGSLRMRLDIRHADGHKASYYGEFPLDGTGIKGNANMTGVQGKGSTISYAKRYLLLMAFNITVADEDNDGNQQHALIDGEEINQLNDWIADCKEAGKPIDYQKFIAWLTKTQGSTVNEFAQVNKKTFALARDFLKRKAGGK